MIRIKNLHKSFDGKVLYNGLNLDVPDQEIVVILGKSGVGKSVLLKHILGLILPDAGQIYVEGTDITRLEEAGRRQMRLRFGMVFQHSALLDSLTVEENVGLGLRKLTSFTDEEIHGRVQECLHAVDLYNIEDMLPIQLSGGMKKRVGFARAVAMNPPYLLYDEPTTGLDPAAASNICNLIVKFNQQFQTTSVVVTHDVVATMKIADRVVLMENGDIIANDLPQKFVESDHPLIKSFLETATLPVH